MLSDHLEGSIYRTLGLSIGKPGLAINEVLGDIARLYGKHTAYGLLPV